MHCLRLRHSRRLFLEKYAISTPFQKRRLSTAQGTSHSGECDVVIVGGGPAGLALANALGSFKTVRESLRIVLVEAGDLSKVRDWAPAPRVFSNRVSSLTNVSQYFLEGIGAWSHLDTTRICPIEEMQVWDGISDARITFSASELESSTHQSTEMAFLTENLNLQRALLRRLNGIKEVQVLDNVKVNSIRREDGEHGGWPLVHLSDGAVFRTRLLVGADGFNSPVRSYADISSYGWSYDTHAIVATLNHPARTALQTPNHVAYQRFLPTGPVAFLPLSPTESSLVWSTKPHLSLALTKSDPAVLASMINATFRLPDVSMRYLYDRIIEAQEAGTPLTPTQIQHEINWRERSHAIDDHSPYSSTVTHTEGIPLTDSDTLPPLVTSIQPGTVASFPLRFNHTESYIGEGTGSRTVLVGDAAHTIHPLAGQGLNMALADVECLARCIHDALLLGGDVGSYTALQPYARERYFENHKLMSAIDKLHKIYSSAFGPLVWARSVGVEVLNEFDTIKAALMMAAGGKMRGPFAGNGVPGTSTWALAASGIQAVTAGMSSANVIKERVIDMVSDRLRELLKEPHDRQK